MAKRKQPEPIVGKLHPETTDDDQVPWSEATAVTAQEEGIVQDEVIEEAGSEVETITAEPVDLEASEEEEEDTFSSLLARAGYMVW